MLLQYKQVHGTFDFIFVATCCYASSIFLFNIKWPYGSTPNTQNMWKLCYFCFITVLTRNPGILLCLSTCPRCNTCTRLPVVIVKLNQLVISFLGWKHVRKQPWNQSMDCEPWDGWHKHRLYHQLFHKLQCIFNFWGNCLYSRVCLLHDRKIPLFRMRLIVEPSLQSSDASPFFLYFLAVVLICEISSIYV